MNVKSCEKRLSSARKNKKKGNMVKRTETRNSGDRQKLFPSWPGIKRSSERRKQLLRELGK